VNLATMPFEVTTMTNVPSDPDWHDDSVLLAELAALNQRIARYVTRMLDADAKRSQPVSPIDEAALGRALREFGERLGERAQRARPSGTTTGA
jgi:hypothetical protein